MLNIGSKIALLWKEKGWLQCKLAELVGALINIIGTYIQNFKTKLAFATK